jgi:hypothetical protein
MPLKILYFNDQDKLGEGRTGRPLGEILKACKSELVRLGANIAIVVDDDGREIAQIRNGGQ